MKILKTLKMPLVLLVALFSFMELSSCSSENNDDGGTGVPDGITINDSYVTNGITVAKTGATITIAAQSKNTITATSSADWISITKGQTTQAMSVTTFTLTVAENPNTDDRTAQVTFKAGNDTKAINVTQTAQTGLVVKTSTFNVGADGGNIEVQLSANEAYECEISDSWITKDGSRAPMTDYTEVFTVAKNAGPSARTATITFKVEGKAETVTVNQAAGSSEGDMSMTAAQVAAQMYPGWNLGNTMEGGSNSNNWKNAGTSSETSWQGTVTTQQIMDLVKSQGFRSVRIPCAWVMGHITDEANCTIDPAWIKRVKEVVGYCLSSGLYVIINQHWDGGWLEHDGFTANTDVEAKTAQLTKIWTQIATEFRDYDQHLLFGGLNEPGVGGKATDNGAIISVDKMSDRLAVYENAFIKAVRATGGNNAQRVLIVQGPNTNIDNFCDNNYMSKITDTATGKLMAEVHFYDPYQFTGLEADADWGKMYYYWGSGNTGSDSNRVTPSKWTESYVSAQMKKMKTNFVDKGYPVLIGEFGANQRFALGKDAAHDASIKAYYKAVTKYAIENGCVPVVWDTNYTSYPSMTVFNRSAVKVFNDNMLTGIKEAVAASQWPQ